MCYESILRPHLPLQIICSLKKVYESVNNVQKILRDLEVILLLPLLIHSTYSKTHSTMFPGLLTCSAIYSGHNLEVDHVPVIMRCFRNSARPRGPLEPPPPPQPAPPARKRAWNHEMKSIQRAQPRSRSRPADNAMLQRLRTTSKSSSTTMRCSFNCQR